MISPIIYGIILGLTHYFSENVNKLYQEHREKIISFGAGISITYLVLLLIPELHANTEQQGKSIFLFLLLGFTLFHVIEKHIYQHNKKDIRLKESKGLHSISFFLYHLIIGIILVNLTKVDPRKGFLFFIPILFHTAVSNISLKEIHGKIREKSFIKFLLSTSTLLGVLIGVYVGISESISIILLGFVTGSLMYIITRDIIPPDNKGNPIYFVVGVIVYMLLIMGVTV